ncbi:hypothetical protein ACFX13_006960 [Malus domestica]
MAKINHPRQQINGQILPQLCPHLDRAELFCCSCRDQVYDRDFNDVVAVDQTRTSIGGWRLLSLQLRHVVEIIGKPMIQRTWEMAKLAT